MARPPSPSARMADRTGRVSGEVHNTIRDLSANVSRIELDLRGIATETALSSLSEELRQRLAGEAALREAALEGALTVAQQDEAEEEQVITIATMGSISDRLTAAETRAATRGEVGPQGMSGEDGDPGIAGIIGIQGPVGFDGPQGARGRAGAGGAQGTRGDPGNRGARGPDSTVRGPVGFTGAQGPAGPRGVAGSQGATGPIGATGPRGANGVVRFAPAPSVTCSVFREAGDFISIRYSVTGTAGWEDWAGPGTGRVTVGIIWQALNDAGRVTERLHGVETTTLSGTQSWELPPVPVSWAAVRVTVSIFVSYITNRARGSVSPSCSGQVNATS